MKNLIYIMSLIIGFGLVSCSESGNEPESTTNTHNTSEPSAAAHQYQPQIDTRSKIPANRLNDGNINTRTRNYSRNDRQGTGTQGTGTQGTGTGTQGTGTGTGTQGTGSGTGTEGTGTGNGTSGTGTGGTGTGTNN